MGFASAWLNERALFPEIIHEAPDKQTGIIVVVPSYNEPGIAGLLDSMSRCKEPDCKVEVIIVVNAPDGASEESLQNNKLTIENIESWKKTNQVCFFRLFAFTAGPVIKGWGVGLARKTGMDEAVRRFNTIDKKEGVILSLDADCLVKQNYLVEVCNGLLKRRDRSACSIYFEHPLSGEEYTEAVYHSIELYELHLRFYYQGLAFSGFPFVFHTVGSACAVKALPYIKVGGMNRKQAGEDFYFIQKLVQTGGYFSLNTTTVYPSPRPSFRVPFGTGASIEKLTSGNNHSLLTYNFLAFNELRLFFDRIDDIYNCRPPDLNALFKTLPGGVKLFLEGSDWIEKMAEIKDNTSGLISFRKRFFGWFNMFKIVKYLNYVHLDYFEKKPVEISAAELLEKVEELFKPTDTLSLLCHYRAMEKNS